MKIAVFCPGWVGDAVMATPALRALRAHFAAAHIVGVMKPYVAGVLEGAPWLDSIVCLESSGLWAHSWLGAARELRSHRPDLAVLFPNTFRTALVAWLAGCRRRVGYDRYGRGMLLTDRLAPLRDRRSRRVPSPIIDSYNQLVERVGCSWPTHRMELFTMPRDEAAADTVWQQTGLKGMREVVCMNPGAAFGAAKHWPVESFVRLARELADRRGSGVLVLCGPAEREMARQIAVGARRPTVHSLADHPVSIGLTKACVRRSSLLITTDSGPRHFAAAFDRPVVTLFGPTHIAWTETFYSGAVHLQKKVPCGPCQKRVCPLDHRCMTWLEPAEVYSAAVQLLDGSRPADTRKTA
jgi:heptosyltransferase-2